MNPKKAPLPATARPSMDIARIPGIAVLGKSVGVLNLIADAPHPLNFTELLARCDLPKATLHRILSALCEYGLLRVDAGDKTYRLGFRIFELAHKVWADFDLGGAAQGELLQLWQNTGETVVLGVISGGHVALLDQRESTHALKLSASPGMRHPLNTTAIGKAILAFMPPAEQARLLAQMDWVQASPHSITDPAAFAAQLQQIRTRGYALEIDENTVGASAVAAPILDPKGLPLGALSLSGPSLRLSEDILHQRAAELIAAARRVARDAGGTVASVEPRPNPQPAQTPARKGNRNREQVRCVLPIAAMLGEGPIWHEAERALYWLDIVAPALHRFDPITGGNDTWPMPSLVGAAALCSNGGLILGLQSGIVTFDPSTGAVTPFAHHDLERPETRYNDGKCDRAGRLWIGMLDTAPRPRSGYLFRLGAQGGMDMMEQGFTVPNGIAFSPDDRSLYFADSGQGTVFRFDFDLATGAVGQRKTLIEVDERDGTPDGITIDRDGYLWVAHWDGWCVRRYAPDGSIDRTVYLPVPRPTSVAFGGDDYKTLFVTTARLRLPTRALAEAPLSGSLFAIDTDVGGLAEPGFRLARKESV